MPELSEPINFGEWLPDQGDFNNPGSLIATNVITQGMTYRPFASLVDITELLPSKCLGAFTYRDAEGNITTFAGTATGLYKLVGLAWEIVTRLSGVYTTASDGFWNFVGYGTLVIATNYNDAIQVYDMASSSRFEELSATAPQCRTMFTLKNFLVCLDTVDGDGPVGYRVKWSPLGDPRGDWTSDPTGTQADFQDIYGGDYSNSFGTELQDFGVIVQGEELWRMEYVGGDTIFSINRIDNGRGSILPRSCISNGRSVFYLSQDGFYEYDGSALIPIGDGKIDKWFYQIFDEVYDYNMNVTIDPIRKLILWSFPSDDATAGMPDLILAFNWGDRKFTLIEQEAELLFTFLSPGYTLEGLDAIYPDLDEMPISLDSRLLTGGKTALGGFTTSHSLGTFTGTPNTATIGTPEVRINDSSRTTVHSIICYVSGGAHSARLGSRNRPNDDVVYTDWVAQNEMTGEVDFLLDALVHRAEIRLEGDWTSAVAIGVRQEPSGRH